MASKLDLSVNVDHIATLRQARGTTYPDPADAARIAEEAGASGITVHLRGDRRHIQDHDVQCLRGMVRGKLNLEIATTREMLGLALEWEPGQVTLVPERPDEITTEGGLDLAGGALEGVREVAQELDRAGIAVSVFLDPDLRQLDALESLGKDLVPGFEINTDAYTKGEGGELERVRAMAAQGARRGFQVFAGHGLTTENVVAIAAIPEIEELNIGHFLVSRASLVGMDQAVREMLAAMASGRQG